MYFSVSNTFTKLFYLLLIFSSQILSAQEDILIEPKFTVQPSSCISLNQGRKCYANVTISWQSVDSANFCLYEADKQVQCWKNSKENTVFLAFESSEDLSYYLIESETEQVFAQATITVSWVHSATPRKRRWRLF